MFSSALCQTCLCRLLQAVLCQRQGAACGARRGPGTASRCAGGAPGGVWRLAPPLPRGAPFFGFKGLGLQPGGVLRLASLTGMFGMFTAASAFSTAVLQTQKVPAGTGRRPQCQHLLDSLTHFSLSIRQAAVQYSVQYLSLSVPGVVLHIVHACASPSFGSQCCQRTAGRHRHIVVCRCCRQAGNKCMSACRRARCRMSEPTHVQ